MLKTVQRSMRSPRNLIVITAIVGIAGTLLGRTFSSPYKIIPPLVTLGALGAAVTYRRRISLPALSPSIPKRPLLSLYFLLVTLTVWTFASVPQYGRTFPNHVLVLALYVLTAVVVLTFDSTLLRVGILLTTGVLHRGLVYYGSATQLGLDGLFHTRMAAEIVANGDLSALGAASSAASKYWYSPAFHLTVAVNSMLSGLPVRDAAFVAITVVATVLPVLVVYALLAPFWNERIAGVGAFLLLAADRSVAQAVHVTPTTLGFVLFSLVVLATVRYIETGTRSYYGLFLLALLGQALNHQVSLFVTLVAVVAYACTRVVWSGRVTRREAALVPGLVGAGLYQGFGIKVYGPGTDLTLAGLVVRNLKQSLRSGTGAAASRLPDTADVVVANSTSLTPVHTLGLALLFGLSVLGAIYWVGRSEGSEQKFVFGLCGTAVVLGVFVFIAPLVGITVFFSYRWIPFLYLLLAALAAPGVAVLLSEGATRFRSGDRKQLVALSLALVLVAAPYVALMTWNYPGALDGPVFDSAPGAQRLTATSTEAATYTHIDRHARASAVYADKTAAQMIERHYGHPAAIYQITYEDSRLVRTENVLVVDRAYSRTQYSQYAINYRDRWFTVFGPLPVERSRYSVVYSAGEDRVLYRGSTSAA